MVYKMIEKRKQLETDPNNAPIVFDQLLTDNLMRQSFPESYALQRRKDRLRTEEQPIRTAPYGKRTRCQTELESNLPDNAYAKRSGQALTAKHATAEQAS